jgi:hypothetical protein
MVRERPPVFPGGFLKTGYYGSMALCIMRGGKRMPGEQYGKRRGKG